MSAAFDLVRFVDGINEVLLERDAVIDENRQLKQKIEQLERQVAHYHALEIKAFYSKGSTPNGTQRSYT